MRGRNEATSTGWSRVGPVCGVLAAVSYIGAEALFPLRGALGVRPEAPAEEIAVAMTERLEGATAYPVMVLFLLSVFLLLVFLGDAHHRMRAATDARGEWLTTVFLGGGFALVAALLLQGFVGLAQITIADVGADVQVAKMLYSLSWLGFGTVIPGAMAMTGAAAVLSLRFGALPKASGVLAAVGFIVVVVMYWIPMWMLWVLATGVALLLERPAARPRTAAAA